MTEDAVPVLKNIHEAILWVMSQVGYVKKTRAGGLNYSFAGERELISAIRPYMVEAGICMYVTKVDEFIVREYVTKSGSAMNDATLRIVVTFVHAPSGTSIDVASRGQGSDTGDKASNKALTGAYKYALRQTFCIETGDDPDKTPSAERKSKSEPSEKKPDEPVETIGAAKRRMTTELTTEFPSKYPDAATIGAALKTLGVVFDDPKQFDVVKAKLAVLALPA